VVRAAKREDLPDFHPRGLSYRAWVTELDGQPVGIIGLALTKPRASLFCYFEDALRPHLKSMPVMRLLKKVEVMFKARGLPVYAIREKNEPKAEAMLQRLGFTLSTELDGDEIWEWAP
jgi:hypothetical protein